MPTRSELSRATARLGVRRDIELLLQEILSPPDEAWVSWREWRKGYRLDDIDIHAMKLIPHVVRRLRDTGSSEDLRRLEGISRYLWLMGERVARAAERCAEILRGAQIDTVAIKGLALRRLGMPNPRPMVDGDLVVVGGEAPYEAGKRLLRKHRWREKSIGMHASTFVLDGAEVDLHLMTVRQDPRFDAMEWSAAGPDGSYRHLDATGSLIVAVLHGMRADGGGLWVLDVKWLAESGSVIWPAVTFYARTRALALTFAAALKRVPSVPPEVLSELEAMPASHVEALELRHLTVPGDRVGAEAARTLAGPFRSKLALVTAEQLRSLEPRPGFFWDPRWVKEWA